MNPPSTNIRFEEFERRRLEAVETGMEELRQNNQA